LILPRKKAELAQGKAAFGPVTLTPDGIQMTSGFVTNFFDWNNLACYTIVNGHLVIQARSRVKKDVFAAILNALFVDHQLYKRLGGDMAVRLADVPNYLVLLALMDGCGAIRR
jgi:hypothetical protein